MPASDPDTVLAGDLAFVERERVRRFAARQPGDRYFPGAPALVVETVSPTDRYSEVADKVQTWLAHGTKVVIVLDPWRRQVEVHQPTSAPTDVRVQTLTEADTLTVPTLFGDWSLPVAAFFADEPAL
ncbi:MAG: Uma2 family endonuclease [Chloroflexi bacterium]|nr:Uma2 family endonuclease [Chloroflexota bacterium]